jgi:hypothetical protein
MSLKSLIATGLTEKQWEDLWARLAKSPRSQIEALAMGFEEWREAVIAEGENRKFIEFAYSGKRISRRKGIARVIDEIKKDFL